jgi:hypothetical protein
VYKKMLLVILTTYVTVYLLLSSFGRFEGNYAAIEKIIGPCLCASSIIQWQPAYVVFASANWNEKPYTNYLGKLYYPLVMADQKYWHITQKIVPRFFTPEEIEIQAKNLKEHGHI